MHEGHDLMNAVMVMHLACAPRDGLLQRIAATWPSAEALRKLPIFWDAAQLALLRGTLAARMSLCAEESII